MNALWILHTHKQIFMDVCMYLCICMRACVRVCEYVVYSICVHALEYTYSIYSDLKVLIPFYDCHWCSHSLSLCLYVGRPCSSLILVAVFFYFTNISIYIHIFRIAL